MDALTDDEQKENKTKKRMRREDVADIVLIVLRLRVASSTCLVLEWAWLVAKCTWKPKPRAKLFATKFSVYKQQQKGIAITLLHDLRWGTWLSYLIELLFLLQIHPNWNMNNAYMLMCKDKPTNPTKKPISILLLLRENLFVLRLCFFEMLLEQIGIYRSDLNQTNKSYSQNFQIGWQEFRL